MQAVGYAYTPIPMCATMPPLTVLGIADSLIRLRLPPGRGHRYNSELESRRTLHENASRHTLSLVGGNVAQFGAPGLRADQPNAHIAPHCADRILVYSIGVDNDAIASGRRIKDLATRGAAELDIVAHSGLGMHALSTAGMLSCTIELHCPPAVVYWSHLSSVVPQHPSMLLGQGLCGLWPCSLLVLRLLLAPGGRVVWWGGEGYCIRQPPTSANTTAQGFSIPPVRRRPGDNRPATTRSTVSCAPTNSEHALRSTAPNPR